MSFVVENDVVLLKSIEKNIGEIIPIDSSQPFHKEFQLTPRKTKKMLAKAKKKSKKKVKNRKF